jgi:predicted transposase/invertase (TIGR01784 family)
LRSAGGSQTVEATMITDPLFYRLFETSPETFFLLLGLPVDSAKEMATRYQYQAIEFKETAHRADGVFLPKEPDLPLYFLEVQFYPLPSVFADLLAKAYTYLKQHEPGQSFCGVVLFASRSLEPGPDELAPYQPLLDAGQIQRFYLDELPELADAPLGLSILYLIRLTETQAPVAARELIARAKSELSDDELREKLVELVETVIMYKLSQLSREEIQTMLGVDDIRQTRVYQEAKEEGLKEGLQKGRQEGKSEGLKEGMIQGRHEGLQQGIALALAIEKMAARNISAEEIAANLKADLELVRRVLNTRE